MKREFRSTIQTIINAKLDGYYIEDIVGEKYSGCMYRGDPAREAYTFYLCHKDDQDRGKKDIPGIAIYVSHTEGDNSWYTELRSSLWGHNYCNVYEEWPLKEQIENILNRLIDKMIERHKDFFSEVVTLDDLRGVVPEGLWADTDAQLLTNLIEHFKYAPGSRLYQEAKQRFERVTITECRDALRAVGFDCDEGREEDNFYLFATKTFEIHFTLPEMEDELLVGELIYKNDPVQVSTGSATEIANELRDYAKKT
nr:hypothetical protein K-LCC10_0127 [Kaumoebavirus]